MTQPKIEDVGHGKPVMPFGSDGTDWYAILIDALGHLQVDVVTAALGSGGATETTLLLIKGYVDALETLLAGGLPAALDSGALKTKEQSPLTGFATSANQTTMITALQLIDDLRAALGSVNTDDLQVDIKTYPGSNILGNFPFGYNNRWAEDLGVTTTDTFGTKNSTPVPAGEVWVLDIVSMQNASAAGSTFAIDLFTSAGKILRAIREAGVAQYAVTLLHGPITMKEGDYIQLVYAAVGVGNVLVNGCWGYKMKIA